MLGRGQWEAFEKALAPDGMFSSCKMLLCMMPEPVAYISNTLTMHGAKVVDDLYGSWGADAHLPETAKFLDTVFRWYF